MIALAVFLIGAVAYALGRQRTRDEIARVERAHASLVAMLRGRE